MELTHTQEFHLYKTNYAAWCAYIAPKWRELLMSASKEEKQRMWNIATPELREEIRKLREAA